MLEILVLGKLKQEDYHKFETSQGDFISKKKIQVLNEDREHSHG